MKALAQVILEGVEVDDLDESVDSLSGYRSLIRGIDPDRVGYRAKSEELDALVAWLQGPVFAEDDPKSVAVLVRTNAQLDEIDGALKTVSIPTLVLRNNSLDDPTKEGVRIATMHRAKGLEFDYVALALLSEEMIPPRNALLRAVDDAGRREITEREKSLLHVASTRARTGLRISWHGSQPTLVKD